MFADKKTGDIILEFKIPDTAAQNSSAPVWAINLKNLLDNAIECSTGKAVQIWFEAT